MKKRIIAVTLLLAAVLGLASCSSPSGRTNPFDDDDDDSGMSTAEEKILDCTAKLSAALTGLDYDKFAEYCLEDTEEVRLTMPVVAESNDGTYIPRPDNTLLTRNMIASTLKYEIDESSCSTGFWGSKYTVDVTYSYKDYSKVLELKDTFISPAEFNTLLYDVNDTVEKTVTLEFKKKDRNFLLVNGNDLAQIFEYEGVEDINYLGALFNMVDEMYLTGDGWDPVTESYYDTNSLEIVLKISDMGKDYTWSYRYRVSIETWPQWTHLYLSDVIVEEGPDEIRIKYTQEENLEPGFYAILFYSSYDSTIVGMEFDVFNSEYPETTETTKTFFDEN